MELYKGRNLTAGLKVDVYRNLHKNGFSIRSVETGLVLAHADAVLIENCTFFVNEKSRQKILECKKRAVHAYIRGTFVEAEGIHPTECTDEIYYNPYITPLFLNKVSNTDVKGAKKIYCFGKVVYGEVNNQGIEDWSDFFVCQ